MPSKKPTVLIVDDDGRMLRLEQRILELENYRVIAASGGEAALGVFDSETPDLVLLDIMMPGMDGHAVCERIREFSQVPIIMVTAKGADEDKVKELDAGADDYVTKPFSSKELVARVRAVLRRAKVEDQTMPSFQVGNMVVDFARRKVFRGEKEIKLTATEYKLLTYLATNAGRVLTTDQILDKVWGEEYGGEFHLLQVNIARLRQKLEDDAKDPKLIITRPGIGYTMADKV